MRFRICSRPGFVPTPMPIVTATTKMIVTSVKALTRTTRWRRFIELEVGSYREGECETLEQPVTGRRLEVIAAARLVDGCEHVRLSGDRSIEDLVVGCDAKQRGDIRIEVQCTILAWVSVVPHIDLDRSDKCDGAESQARRHHEAARLPACP